MNVPIPEFCLQLTVTFLHFLWQGTLLGVFAWALTRSSSNAKFRYAVHLGALLAMLLCVPLTFTRVEKNVKEPAIALQTIRSTAIQPNAPNEAAVTNHSPRTPSESAQPAHSLAISTDSAATTSSETIDSAANSPGWNLSSFAPFMVCLYVLGVIGLMLRLMLSICCAHRLKWRATRLSDETLLASIEKIGKRLGLRPTPRLAICARVAAPVVIGILRPTILLPTSMVTGLNADEVSAILSHEMAHLQRNDLFVNLVQRVVESLLFFHPVVWMVSRQVSRERENCCDDMVLNSGFRSMDYVSALLRMAEECMHAKRDPFPANQILDPVALSAAGQSPSEFKRRVLRLMGEPRPQAEMRFAPVVLVLSLSIIGFGLGTALAEQDSEDSQSVPNVAKVSPSEWPQFGGNAHRNHVATGENIPTSWDVREGENIQWRADLRALPSGFTGTFSPVIADGRIFVGTANPDSDAQTADQACIVCLDQATGERLWVYRSKRLSTGRSQDWPKQAMASTPCVDGERMYFASNRCELVCLNVVSGEPVWKLDMIGELSVSPHRTTRTSPTVVGDLVLIGTSNGVHTPGRPCFVAVNKTTGKVVWQDDSGSKTTLDSQMSSPAYGVFDGVPQVIFPGSDGWLYSFDYREIRKGKSVLLWKFDANPKDSEWVLGSRGTRNHFFASPVIYEGLVYIAVGQQPEHGEGNGHLWCIDPKGRGDISPELVFSKDDPATPKPHSRLQAADPDMGDIVQPNPNTGVVWHFDSFDKNQNGERDFDETMHRAIANVSISNGLLVIADFSGLLHCLDARTGKSHWAYDMFAAAFGSALIVDDKIYVGDEDGEIAIIKLSDQFKLIDEVSLLGANYGSVTCVNNTLYLTDKRWLIAVRKGAKSEPMTPEELAPRK